MASRERNLAAIEHRQHERRAVHVAQDLPAAHQAPPHDVVLLHSTPAEVKDQVKGRLEICAPGGGFVSHTAHNILPEVPPQHIVAMFEAIEVFPPSP